MPDYTFASLKSGLIAYNHHYLEGNSVVGDWANEAVEEVVLDELWSWRKTSKTQVLPAVIPDLAEIEQVLGPDGVPLTPERKDRLRDRYPGLAESGTPNYYWREGKEVGVYPLSSAQFTVVYFTTYGWVDNGGTPKASATVDSDKPIIPLEDRGIVMMLMRAKAKSAAQDQDEAVAIRQNEYQPQLERMLNRERTDVDELMRVKITNTDDWA